jgi:hypothetical protein
MLVVHRGSAVRRTVELVIVCAFDLRRIGRIVLQVFVAIGGIRWLGLSLGSRADFYRALEMLAYRSGEIYRELD